MKEKLTRFRAAIARELAMRRSVYPRWVAAKKMTHQKADAEIAVMAEMLEWLDEMLDAGGDA